MTKFDVLKKKADSYRRLAVDARMLARDYIEYKDEAPVGYHISNGEMYHAHLRCAERFEGMAQGIESAIKVMSEVAV